ncbi:uncharacterized protein LOC131947932 [Physella acuta]|uniref:uncharacterized protein LOC131947932 n=1 Tax=Physella acuta TaxID=109671 RepID=UPI0027DD09B0|nr:uncharacterized protein LOC131947932 [Physella acuta]
MEDLPEADRDKDTRKLIETVAKLTCKVTVRNTALDRPKYYPGTTKLYPTHRGRRHSEMRTGSGVVYFSSGIFRNESSRCCCHDCQEVNDPVVGFTVVYVRTAKHVVFNTIEATYARFSFKNTPGDKLMELAGISVVDSDIESDFSIVECVTHELDAAELFEGIQKEMMRLDTLIRSRSNDRKIKISKLAVVVSHPHGWGKVVSVGESVRKAVTNQTVDDMQTSYSHTSMTCPGSSGGPVVLMDQKEPKVLKRFLMPHVHSCGEGVQKGFSGQGVSGFVKLT